MPHLSSFPPSQSAFGRTRTFTERRSLLLWAGVLVFICGLPPASLRAQAPVTSAERPSPPAPQIDELSPATTKVEVNPLARDDEIGSRLQRVLDATDWFTDPQVRVDEGVVFLSGQAPSAELKRWAGDLARNTQDVVAVVNRIEIPEPSIWDLSPAWNGLLTLWRDVIRSFPMVLFGLLILGLSVGAGLLGTRTTHALLRPRIHARLLRNVLAGCVGVFVVLVGTYIVLRVAGLTQLALTVVGGTGLIGLAVGIAFRDITENFLASIFLSMQQPFETGDLIEVTGVTGYVQQLNVRTTVLMTLDGNLVQIPNASVYKNNVRNFTTNSNRRGDFVVGISYDDSINEAQEIARKVLIDHPAVLTDPEPLVLVDNLGKSTVDLRIYFWIDGRRHSHAKVRSSLIRLVKRAYQQQGISMPDEAREVVFPQGIPVTMVDANPSPPKAAQAKRTASDSRSGEMEAITTKAEGGLDSEAGLLEEQARQSHSLQEGENLLPTPPPRAPAPRATPDARPTDREREPD